ncbi:MAG TPA: sigma 54-interacting transcriptional regulator, partial [Pirellulaceae bacterium]
FGHEAGAFTDARETRPGKFELADGGTLMLDEIGDMSPRAQAKLLRVLDDQCVTRVGGQEIIRVNTRVIAATNRDLAELVREKRFREDLFFRLHVVAIEIPPLRERGDDVLLLADRFLADFAERNQRPALTLLPSARKRLVQHPWPGNVRELRNLMERLTFLHEDEGISDTQLALDSPPLTARVSLDANLPLSEATRQFQIRFIQSQIAACGGNMTDAADSLGLHRTNLYRKMKQLGVKPEEPNALAD